MAWICNEWLIVDSAIVYGDIVSLDVVVVVGSVLLLSDVVLLSDVEEMVCHGVVDYSFENAFVVAVK